MTMHNSIIFVSHLKETLKGDFTASQGVCPDQIYSDQTVLGTVRQQAGPFQRWLKVLKTKLAQGHQAQALLGQMVLMMVRREARPRERWPKMLMRE
jgi:hypothetical protein